VSTPFVTRFAPSPSGFLHRGHAYSALKASEAAREAQGRFLLRIEDIDTARCRQPFEEAIYEDLAWLGLEWEEPVRRQSDHLAEYGAALEDLRERGLLYRCFRTRKDVLEEIARAPHGHVEPFRAGPLSDKEEEPLLAEDRAYAWRLSLPAARKAASGFTHLAFMEEGEGPDGETGLIRAHPEALGDVVLGRKDLGVSYHLAVVVDDAAQGITHVVRGEDLFEAAHIQRLLQELLGLPTPTYRHHRLLVGADGQRYAKRDRAETLREIRARGVTAQELRAELGFQ